MIFGINKIKEIFDEDISLIFLIADKDKFNG